MHILDGSQGSFQTGFYIVLNFKTLHLDNSYNNSFLGIFFQWKMNYIKMKCYCGIFYQATFYLLKHRDANYNFLNSSKCVHQGSKLDPVMKAAGCGVKIFCFLYYKSKLDVIWLKKSQIHHKSSYVTKDVISIRANVFPWYIGQFSIPK